MNSSWNFRVLSTCENFDKSCWRSYWLNICTVLTFTWHVCLRSPTMPSNMWVKRGDGLNSLAQKLITKFFSKVTITFFQLIINLLFIYGYRMCKTLEGKLSIMWRNLQSFLSVMHLLRHMVATDNVHWIHHFLGQ